MSAPIGNPNNLDRLNIGTHRVEATDAATTEKVSKKRARPDSTAATAIRAAKVANGAINAPKLKEMRWTRVSSSDFNGREGLHNNSKKLEDRKTTLATHRMLEHTVANPSLATVQAHTPPEWHSQAGRSEPAAIGGHRSGHHHHMKMDTDDDISEAMDTTDDPLLPISASTSSLSSSASRSSLTGSASSSSSSSGTSSSRSSVTDASIDALEDDHLWGSRNPGGGPPPIHDPAAAADLAAPTTQAKIAEIKQEMTDLAKRARELNVELIKFRQKTIETSKKIDNTDGDISTPKATYHVDKEVLKKNEDELKACIKKLWTVNEKFQALEGLTDSPDVREILANVTMVKKDLFEARKIVNDITFYDNTQTLYRFLNHFNKVLETMNQQINDILHLPGLQPRFPDIF